MTDRATLSSKYRLSIPKAVRKAMRWKAGQTFAFVPKGAGVMLVPVPTFESLRGAMRGADPTGYRDRGDA